MSDRGYFGESNGRKPRFVLEAKYNVPFAWLLPFSSARAGERILSVPVAEGRATLAARAHRLRPHLGPKLAGVFEGFVRLVGSFRKETIVLDATELDHDLAWLLSEIEKIDRGELDDLDLRTDWEIRTSGEGRDLRFELEGPGTEATYRSFGGSLDGEMPWLRPPTRRDGTRTRAVAKAMEGYEPLADPIATEDGRLFLFTHPAHEGIFAVRTGDDEGFEFSAHESRAAAELSTDFESLDFGTLQGAERLAAWASHVAACFSLLRFATRGGGRWWQMPGGEEFGARMQPFEPDREVLRASLPDKLRSALAHAAQTGGIVDLGPFGSAVFERVEVPEWEPHARTSLRPTRGDMSWRTPSPELLLSPADQWATGDAFLADLHRAGSITFEPLVVTPGSIAPERVAEGFRPARAHAMEETPATVIFAGANLLIAMAGTTRVSFHFRVPPGIAKGMTVAVSGWWTAPSGDRFAGTLRLGAHVYHFDNAGKLRG